MYCRIGEAAEILGITKEGVRYLERKGLITSHRNPENGYRYYDRSDLALIQQIRLYEGLGMSLSEASDMLLKSSPQEIVGSLETRRQEIEKEMEALQQKLQAADTYLASTKAAIAHKKQYGFVHSSAYYYLPTEGKKYCVNSRVLRSMETAWSQADIGGRLAKFVMDQKGNVLHEKGLLIEEEQVSRVPVNEDVIYLPSHLVYEESFAKPVGDSSYYPTVYRRIQRFGYQPSGDMLTITLMSAVISGKRSTITRIQMPVVKK